MINTRSAGALDAVEDGDRALTVSGWSVDLTQSTPSFVWVDFDGLGDGFLADARLDWFEALFPGAGLQHGYQLTIAAGPGTTTSAFTARSFYWAAET